MHLAKKLPISVCMIVRNEEKNLPAALESIRDRVGEVVIVDTGSSDRTMEIAREFGAHLLESPWRDDFSRPRNLALQAASCDWILTLDADQRIAPSSWPALATAVKRPELAQMVTIHLVNDDVSQEQLGSYTALRLFKRHEHIRYRGRIHENITESLLEIGSTEWPNSKVILLDIGYNSADERQRKRDRNLLLLEQSHAEAPDDLFIAYKLAITFPPERKDERNELLFKSIENILTLPEKEIIALPFIYRLLAVTVDAYVEQGKLCDAADAALAMLPYLGYSCYFTAGRAIARTGQTALATEMLTHFLSIDSQPINMAIQPDPEANKAETYRWLGWLARMSGDVPQARIYLQSALKTATLEQKITIECECIRLNISAGQFTEAARHIDRLHPMVNSSANAYSELMLISAELSNAIGDQNGAKQLALAALTVNDDRPAMLLAILELKKTSIDKERCKELMMAIAGRQYDSLAIRLMLATSLDIDIVINTSIATKEFILH